MSDRQSETRNSVRANGTNWATQNRSGAFVNGEVLSVRLNPDMPYHKIYALWLPYTVSTGASGTAVLFSKMELMRDNSVIMTLRCDGHAGATAYAPINIDSLFGPPFSAVTGQGGPGGESLNAVLKGMTGRFALNPISIFGYADTLRWTFVSQILVTGDAASAILVMRSTPVLTQ